MIAETGEGLFTLWASDGTPHALSTASVIQRWLLPVSRRIDVLSVAPVSRTVTSRMTHWTEGQREQDMQEAMEAGKLSLEALGETDAAGVVHTRWGTASREIILHAEECHADVVVVGPGSPNSLQKAVLGGTARETLLDTTRSVFLARASAEEDSGAVIVLYSSQRLFANAIAMLRALNLSPDVAVSLMATLEPVKPFGSMFVTLNEEIRVREQAAHDAQADVLREHLAETASKLQQAEGKPIATVVRDCEPAHLPAALEQLRPALVIVGDSAHADPMSVERRNLSQLATKLSRSVLVAR